MKKKRRFTLEQGRVVYSRMIHSQEVAQQPGSFIGGGQAIVKTLRNKDALKVAARSV